MTGLLRKILPATRSSTSIREREEEDDDDRYKTEYSIAIEYSGPALTYAIPQVLPVDVSQLPLAAQLPSAAMLDHSLPIIPPIVKSNKLYKRPIEEVKLEPGNRLYVNDRNDEGDDSGSMSDSNADGCGIGMLNNEIESYDGNDEDEMCDSHNSGRLRACDGTHEISGNLKLLDLPDTSRNDAVGDFEGYMNPDDRESVESDLRSPSVSSEIFSGHEEDCVEEGPSHAKRPSVTFREAESCSVFEEESDQSDVESRIMVRKMAVRPGKKGTCYRCMKGNRFTEKEFCIVCGAKYCCHCVLRAMGSMPEGRKCITCIGYRIAEANRKDLGKCSRMLKRLLPESEVKEKMRYEKFCDVNQLPPDLIYVNREALSQIELSELRNCQWPPKKLEPGYYWYDKVSGFWGKEGEKPCQIISSQLDVGGRICRDASNGNTNILINNREITKSELLMLQFVGVKCEGTTHFWVSADGSYQEEGMNNIKGKIWEKRRAKLICAALSLPTPPDSGVPTSEEVDGGKENNLDQQALYKLLLLGSTKSGTSTIFKQAKIIYHVPFSEDERQSIKSVIQCNLYRYLGILLEVREQFEEESLIGKKMKSVLQCSSSGSSYEVDDRTLYSLSPKLKHFSDLLLNVIASGNLETMFPAATREYAPLVEKLWKDGAIQATYNRRNELESLPRVATYFLERAVEIAKVDYEPSEMDILYAEGVTSTKGLSCMEFSFPKLGEDTGDRGVYQHDDSLRYQLIRVHPRTLGENRKWLEMFEDIDMVTYCVSLTDYDEFYEDANGVTTNKMIASKEMFESIVTHPTFEKKKFLLVLTKFDLFEEKIEVVPLARCQWFSNFNPVIGHNPATSSSRNTNPSLAHRAFQYIAVKFKRLFSSLSDRKLYVSLVTGLEPDNVDEALRYARDVLKWDEEELHFPNNNEISSASMEASSSS